MPRKTGGGRRESGEAWAALVSFPPSGLSSGSVSSTQGFHEAEINSQEMFFIPMSNITEMQISFSQVTLCVCQEEKERKSAACLTEENNV